jgi:hypothetical protein
MANFFNRIIDPFVRRNKWTQAQQQQHYKRAYNAFDHQGTKFGRQMIPSATEMEDVTTASAGDFQQQIGQLNSFIYRAEPNKIAKLQAWRDMAMFPEISFALGEIEDEAVNFNAQNDFIELIIDNPRFQNNENILRNLSKEWEYIIKDVMDADHYINEWFMEYMIDGEIFFEKVVDPITAKDRGILRVKRLRPDYTFPIWEEIESDRIFEFIHKSDTNILRMPPEMVAYANSGIYKYPDRYTKEVVSYLETAKVDYRKLKQLEDALVIYRLVRAPERRVFKIEVGKLPKAKAEQYVQQLMKKYRQRKVYDPATGEASQLIDTMAMVEDFWLPSQDGKGSSIDTLPGGESLGQIEDVIYFLKKLYRALRIPMSRMEQDTGFSLGDTSDITREEVRFHKMIQKFVNRFTQVFVQIFISHLRLKGYADEYGITEKDFTIKMSGNNIFQDFMESEIMTQRSENFERFIDYAEGDPESGQKPLFSKKWLMKRFLKFNEKEILENEEYLKQEELEKKAENKDGEGGDLDDLISGEGGGGGGGDDIDLDKLGGDGKSKDKDGLGDLEDLNDPDAEPKDKKDKDKGDDSDIESFA